MLPDDGRVAGNPNPDPSYSDEAGRPLGEFEPAALGRLARLHGETVETARLADLLGRTPLAAAALVAGCALIAMLTANRVSPFSLGLWLLFVAAAAFALLRLTRNVSSETFELLHLRAFALDLHAVMLYAGFAWGAGAYLGLPLDAGALGLAGFAFGSGAAIAAIVQARTALLYFLAPNIALAASAALLGPAGAGAGTAILLSGLAILAAAAAFERFAARRNSAPALPTLTIS